jgi:F-type H+-transporting ATPase subunit delta
MSVINEVSKRYATALLDTAGSDGLALEEQLISICNAFKQDEKMQNLFETPRISSEAKKAIFKRAFDSKVDPIILSFISLLIDKNREEAIYNITEALILENNKRLGRVRAQVTVSSKDHFDSGIEQEIKALIENNKERFGITAKSKLNIEVSVNENPSLLGGLELKVDDYLWDASVISYLKNWKRKAEDHKVIATNAWSA